MCNWKKALDRSLNWVDDHTREEASDCGGGSTAGNPARAVSALKSVSETTTSSGGSHSTSSSTTRTTTEHITAVVHTGVSASTPSTASSPSPLLGLDACPAMNVSVVHKAVGYVALAFCVGIAAGAGFVVGVDLIRSVKSGK
jgi:hypothetical protein